MAEVGALQSTILILDVIINYFLMFFFLRSVLEFVPMSPSEAERRDEVEQHIDEVTAGEVPRQLFHQAKWTNIFCLKSGSFSTHLVIKFQLGDDGVGSRRDALLLPFCNFDRDSNTMEGFLPYRLLICGEIT